MEDPGDEVPNESLIAPTERRAGFAPASTGQSDAVVGERDSPKGDEEGIEGDAEASGSLPRNDPPRWRILRTVASEVRSSPIASLAAVVSLTVVIATTVTFVTKWVVTDDMDVQISPINFRTGQSTSANVVVPDTNISEGDLPNLGSTGDPEFENWFDANDVVFADSMEISFLARSDKTQPSVIVGARVIVERRDSPLAGTWIPPAGAGPGPNRVLHADLDTDPVEVWTDGGWEYPLHVSEDQTETFTVVATTKDCYCAFSIALDYIASDGDVSTYVIRDSDGELFELTSTTNASKM